MPHVVKEILQGAATLRKSFREKETRYGKRKGTTPKGLKSHRTKL